MQIKNNNYFSYYGLALAYYNTGAYPDSISTLLEGESYAHSPRDQYQLYHVRGSAYFNTRNFEATVSDLKKAISIQRGDPEDILQLGIANYHLGRQLEAKTFLTQALALNPENLDAKRYLSRLHYQEAINAIDKQNFEKAISILQKTHRPKPSGRRGMVQSGFSPLVFREYTGCGILSSQKRSIVAQKLGRL